MTRVSAPNSPPIVPHLFQRYIGVDYSGARTPVSGLTGLRVYVATAGAAAVEVVPPPGGTPRHWTRHGVAHWLQARLREPVPTIVGIDHGFSFPLRYFEQHRLALDWDAFLQDFQHHWPTAADRVSVEAVRRGQAGDGAARAGNAKWRRLAEQRCRAKSVFHFDCPGSVAKSTHAGLPWLWWLRQTAGPTLHVWPFDGWAVPPGRPVLAEAYPALYRPHCPVAPEGLTGDQHDAWAIATWLRQTDASGELSLALQPKLDPEVAYAARVEGWILGVVA